MIAERTGVPVVSDFRTRDIAAGGQGAPLVPFVDYLLFRHPKRTRIALNIGGIANITVIPAGARPEDVIAFDTGPGNMVIDALVARVYRRTAAFRPRWRNRAPAHKLTANCSMNCFATRTTVEKPPKSAGREQYGKEFVERLKRTGLPIPELIATATMLTCATIAIGIERFTKDADDLIVSGGGVHNRQIVAHLHALLPRMTFATTNDYGIDSDAKEAIAFAMLAYETFHRRPGNLPSATGAKRVVILGKITL